ncbi:kinase-like domain-containing protein [Cladorrhinum sp. PSN332]|nr:kinase-like domain-containing protein [Cladorrhinum sp. PSN332]
MATSSNPSRLPELVRDTQLQARVQGATTIHVRRTGRRAASREERWTRVDNRILGQGGGGTVWVERKENTSSEANEKRAVKAIRIGQNKSLSETVRYVRELEALAKFSQEKYAEFFVKSYGWYELTGWLCIAMEYCEHGDLRRYLDDVGKMPEAHVRDVTSQIVAGLAMMHDEGFAHRDLKPANILIKAKPPDEWWVKLCDLGLSKRAGDAVGASTIRGTPGFWAPEILGLGGSDPKMADPTKVDIWCLGETVVQMLTGCTAFDSIAGLVQYYQGEPFPIPRLRENGLESLLAIDFVTMSMARDPPERLGSIQATPKQPSQTNHTKPRQPKSPLSPHSLVDHEDKSQPRAATARLSALQKNKKREKKKRRCFD